MLIILRLLGQELSIQFGPVEYEEEVIDEGSSHLSIVDSAFGFAPDPVFPELDWGDDDERHKSSTQIYSRSVCRDSKPEESGWNDFPVSDR